MTSNKPDERGFTPSRTISPKKKELIQRDQDIYNYIYKKIGYKRTPTPIPINKIAKATKGTYKQTRNSIERITKQRIIEKWTTKHPRGKITYFRVPYTIETKLSEVKRQDTEKNVSQETFKKIEKVIHT